MIKLQTEKVYGWSRSTFSNSLVHQPSTIEEIYHIIQNSKKNNQKIACRGAGRSYGDNSLNEKEIILDITYYNKIIDWNPQSGIIKTQGGVTIEDILLKCTNSGWSLPVMPGTRYVTIAGALANNVHGKNAFHQGCIGEHVNYFKIILADSIIYHCTRSKNSDLFYSAIGGLGLLGVIVEVGLKLRRITSYYLTSKVKKYDNIIDLYDDFELLKDKYEYSIAWIDTIKSGKNLGRGEINYAQFLDDEDYTITDHEIPKNSFGFISNKFLPNLTKIFLNTNTMRIVNWLQVYSNIFSSDVQKQKISFSKFNFLIDMKYPYYNYFFKYGFFEYQPILPFNKSAKGFKDLIKITQKYGFQSVQSSSKAYRNQNEEFLLSFPKNGFAITLDIPKDFKRIKEQIKMFHEMNDVVIANDGKIYLGKTPVINKTQFYEMYKNLDKFLSIKNKYDPNSIFESNMYRRIMDLAKPSSPFSLEHSI